MSVCRPREEIPPDQIRMLYVPYIIGYYLITCENCKTDPICPYGAIKFDADDNCYVDQEDCRGLSHDIIGTETVDGRTLKVRVNEEKCWACFEGEESLSNRCLHHRVGRVLKIGGC
jgi:hypothetical protein